MTSASQPKTANQQQSRTALKLRIPKFMKNFDTECLQLNTPTCAPFQHGFTFFSSMSLEALAALVSANTTSTANRHASSSNTRPRSAFAAAMEQRRRSAEYVKSILNIPPLEDNSSLPSVPPMVTTLEGGSVENSSNSSAYFDPEVFSSSSNSRMVSRRRQPALPADFKAVI